jgi:hypothetical protein
VLSLREFVVQLKRRRLLRLNSGLTSVQIFSTGPQLGFATSQVGFTVIAAVLSSVALGLPLTPLVDLATKPFAPDDFLRRRQFSVGGLKARG